MCPKTKIKLKKKYKYKLWVFNSYILIPLSKLFLNLEKKTEIKLNLKFETKSEETWKKPKWTKCPSKGKGSIVTIKINFVI